MLNPSLKSARLACFSKPACFKRSRVLLVGYGDVASRLKQQLPAHIKVLAVSRLADTVQAMRAQGVIPIVADLDHAPSLRRLGALAGRIVHLAPPAAQGRTDMRTSNLIRSLQRHADSYQHRLVYGSTSGVYGNRQGQWIDETTTVNPTTDRAHRRVHAERQLRVWGKRGAQISILRIPGIYALDRVGGSPKERLLRGTPSLMDAQDSYSNHIHADDLARACKLALWRAKPQRIYHCNDDSSWKMGEYFACAARIMQLPAPARISWEEAQSQLPATLLSFMAESRRLKNDRIKKELRLQWRYPTPEQGLKASAC